MSATSPARSTPISSRTDVTKSSRASIPTRTDPRIRTPFRTNLDLSIAKRGTIRGQLTAQLRVEILNVLNSLRFANGPEARVGNASFGRITSQGGLTRQTQVTLRLGW